MKNSSYLNPSNLHSFSQLFSPNLEMDYFKSEVTINSQTMHQSTKNMLNSLNLKTIVNNMNKILQIKPGNQNRIACPQNKSQNSPFKYAVGNNNINQRQKYSSLLNWHQVCLTQIRRMLKANQISIYDSIQKQQQILLLAMRSFAQNCYRECQEKGMLAETLIKQHVSLHFGLVQYMDYSLKKNFVERVEAQNKMQADYDEEISKLKQQLQSLTHEKDRKWKNLFMLIKDNRILRRTRGKLMRQLQAANYRQQSLKQNIIQLTRQNERYKLLLHEQDGQKNGIQRWLKNLSSLMKIQKYIQKQPLKAKRVLQFQLENLQISEMQTLPQKIQYIIKAIEQAEQLVDYYEDFTDFITPCKLLLNNYTQTEQQKKDFSTNTPTFTQANVYCQARSCDMLTSKLKLCKSKVNFYYPDINNPTELSEYERKIQNNLFKQRKYSNNSLSCRSERPFPAFRPSMSNELQSIAPSVIKKGNFRIVKTAQQSVFPKYIASSFYYQNYSGVHQSINANKIMASTNKNYMYYDSKFAHKLDIYTKAVVVMFRGVTLYIDQNSITSANKRMKNKTTMRYSVNPIKSINYDGQQKQHMNNQEQLQLQNYQQSLGNPSNSQPRAYLQKRYSHNISNTMFLHNKLKMSNISVQNGNSNQESNDVNTSRQSAKLQNSQLNFGSVVGKKSGNVIDQQKEQISDSYSQDSRTNSQKSKQDKRQNKNVSIIRTKLQNITRQSTISAMAGYSNTRVKTQPNDTQRNSKNISNFSRSSSKFAGIQNQLRQVSNSKQSFSVKSNYYEEMENNIKVKNGRKSELVKNADSPRQMKKYGRNSYQVPPVSSFKQMSKKNRLSSLKDEGLNKQNSNNQNSLYNNNNEDILENSRDSDDSSNNENKAELKQKIVNKSSNKKSNGNVRNSINKIDKTKKASQKYSNKVTSRNDSKLLASAYQPIQEIMEENMINNDNEQQQQIQKERNKQGDGTKNRNINKVSKSETKINIKQPTPMHSYFYIEAQIQAVDANKVINKILRYLYANRNQLKNSQKTLKQYLQANLKNIYGMHPQSQFNSFNKSLAMELEPHSHAQAFIRMLNFSTPIAYQADLLKIYLMLMEKAGEGMQVDMESATWIMAYINSIFYNEKCLQAKMDQMKSTLMIMSLNAANLTNKKKNYNGYKLCNLAINLNQYFILLQSDLRKKCLQTEFYQFCSEILPQNQTDLNYQQIWQILRFLPQNTQLQVHMSRVKFYSFKDSTKSMKNCGMKLHKISLYCVREQWEIVKDIISTIETKFRNQMESNLNEQQLLQLYTKLQNQEFGTVLIKSQCPWLYSIARKFVKKCKDYECAPSKTLLKLIWLIQTNLKFENLNVLFNNIDFIAEKARKLIVKNQLQNFIGNTNKEVKKQNKSRKQKSNLPKIIQQQRGIN